MRDLWYENDGRIEFTRIFVRLGQWGWPTFHLSSILGMLAGVLACTVESLGYYPTIAKMSGKVYRVYRPRLPASNVECRS